MKVYLDTGVFIDYEAMPATTCALVADVGALRKSFTKTSFLVSPESVAAMKDLHRALLYTSWSTRWRLN